MGGRLHLKRNLPVDGGWDVIVVGGGPSGCAAAIAAARGGARALLLERGTSLGGMGTSGLVPTWAPLSDRAGNLVYRGLAKKIVAASKAGMRHVKDEEWDWVPIDPERLKLVYDEFLSEAGVEVRFQSSVVSVEMDGSGTIGPIICADKSGLSALRAKVYVDCSGDGDVCAFAGAAFEKGDEGTGELMPATHCFMICNIDEEALDKGPNLFGGDPRSPVYKMLASGRYPFILDSHLCIGRIGLGAIGFNAGHMWDVDEGDPKSVSQALMQGRRIAMDFLKGLAEFRPEAFKNAFLATTGALLGVREGRRIIGDCSLSVDDYRARRSFSDEIGRNNYFLDVHTRKSEQEEAKKGVGHLEARFEYYKPGESHGIPYRCLTPKGLKNALVAGRAISCDKAVQGSIRVMPACIVTGEASGAAAAMAAKEKVPDVHAVNVGELRASLLKEGAFLL